MRRIAIIDVSSILHTVKHSIGKKNKLSHKETFTFVIFGFLFRLRSIALNSLADTLVFALDSNSSIRRDKYYAQYKMKRATAEKTEEQKYLDEISYPQFDAVKKYVIPTLGFRNVFMAEGFEADDIIASICKKYDEREICIVSSDEDMYQLITNNISILHPRNYQWYTKSNFIHDYGIEPNMWKRVKVYGGCFDRETEVLTDRGWVYFPDIKFSDKVYSMDPDSRTASYESISNIVRYKYEGDMYRIKGRLIDLLVTPDHKFFGSTTQSYPSATSRHKIQFKEIKEIVKYKNFTIPISSNWKGNHVGDFAIPELKISWGTKCQVKGEFTSKKVFSEKRIDMDVWLAFLGIWLADGHVSKNANGNIGTIAISANKDRKKEYFQPILNSTPWNWNRGKNGWRTDNRQLAAYLQGLGTAHTKHIPRELLDLPTEQLQILFDSMMSGNGCISTWKQKCFGVDQIYTSTTYYSSSRMLIDNFQEIAIKLGYATSIHTHEPKEWHIKGKSGWSKESYSINMLKSNNINLLKSEIEIVKFNDCVFDVETSPNHTLFVRRNGNSVWSSNCKSDGVPGLPIPSADPTAKVRHIGEKTAINYILNSLNPETNTYKAFISKESKAIINRNKYLTILPLVGTPEYHLQEDTRLSRAGLLDICKKYGFNSIMEDLTEFCKVLRLR